MTADLEAVTRVLLAHDGEVEDDGQRIRCTGVGCGFRTETIGSARTQFAAHIASVLVSLPDLNADTPTADAPVCPECGVRRADWNVDGGRLPFCPNCGGDNPGTRTDGAAAAAEYARVQALPFAAVETLPPTADAVPDVPPDPPAADVEAIARVLVAHRLVAGHKDIWTMCVCGVEVDNSTEALSAHRADALLSSGVLVDAADVRARALEDAAEPGALVAAAERGLLTTRDYLLARAVSEREGTT